MGADTFTAIGHGSNAQEAFNRATEDARYWNGHGGYTGTIAEKSEFTVIRPGTMSYDEAQKLANEMIANDDDRIDDKWGPAGAIEVDPETLPGHAGREDGKRCWLFFGWASS